MDMHGVTGFDWDEGNATKNEKHGVSRSEVERVFVNRPLLVVPDQMHSQDEDRFAALGATDEGRWLAVVFTLREGKTKIRPISARQMNRKERKVYEEAH
jgi:uncharacterized DUF497 family protein